MIDRRRFLKALGLGSVAVALSVVSRGEARRLANARAAVRPSRVSQPQGGASSAAVAPRAVAAAGAVVRFRGEGGVILASVDDGATWTRHSHLGPAYRVGRVQASRKGEVQARIRYAGRSFRLRLAEDGLAWRTA